MNSVTSVTEIHGSRFGAAVTKADEVSATAPAETLSLPDRTVSLLTELSSLPAEEKTERDALISERCDLNQRTLAFVERALVARRAGLLQKHEEVKAAVRRQLKLVEDLKEQIAVDSQEALRAENKLRQAQTAAFDATNALKGLSRFSKAAAIDAARARVEAAEKKTRESEKTSAEWRTHVHHQQFVVMRNESIRLDELVTEELRMSELLEGRDPSLREFGFVVA